MGFCGLEDTLDPQPTHYEWNQRLLIDLHPRSIYKPGV